MSGEDCPSVYSRRQDRPKTLHAKEAKAFSRDNELCGPKIHCSCQGIEKESKGKEGREYENKGKIYLEIIDGINNEIIKKVYIRL